MMKPETKSRKLEFYGKQLKHAQEKSRKFPHDKKLRAVVMRLMDKIDKIKIS